MSFAESFAMEVRIELARQRKSRAGLAKALGISNTYAERIVKGLRPFPLDRVELAADYLEVPPLILFERALATKELAA